MWTWWHERFRSVAVRPRVEVLEDRLTPAEFRPLAAAADSATDPASLRTSIRLANSNGQDDVIYLQAGVYTLSVRNTAGQENAALQGDLDLTEAGRLITFRGAGAGATVIEANGLNDIVALHDRVFHILPNVTAIFSDLTIRGGLAFDDGTAGAPAGQGNGLGAGILNQGTLQLEHVIVIQNFAWGGNGANGSAPGEAGRSGGLAQGGGIYSTGPLTLLGGMVLYNWAGGGRAGTGQANAGGRGGDGGSGGHAMGGGIFATDLLNVFGTTIAHNSAAGSKGGSGGSGISGGNGGPGGSALGGGVYAAGLSTFVNTTVSSNGALGGDGGAGGTAGGDGGDGGDSRGAGILGSAEVNLRNSTVAANTAHSTAGGPSGAPGGTSGTGRSSRGGGVYLSLAGARLVSTLLGDNTAQNAPDFSGTVLSAMYTLLENAEGSGVVNGGLNRNLVGPDPRLGNLQDNGGPTWTHALLPDSPAIDTGANPDGLENDQRGRPRVVNGQADIGAFEFIPRPRPAPVVSAPVRPVLVALLSRRRGKTWVQFLDARTGAVWLRLRFAERVRLAMADVNADGVTDFLVLRRVGRRLRRLAFSGLDLAPLAR